LRAHSIEVATATAKKVPDTFFKPYKKSANIRAICGQAFLRVPTGWPKISLDSNCDFRTLKSQFDPHAPPPRPKQSNRAMPNVRAGRRPIFENRIQDVAPIVIGFGRAFEPRWTKQWSFSAISREIRRMAEVLTHSIVFFMFRPFRKPPPANRLRKIESKGRKHKFVNPERQTRFVVLSKWVGDRTDVLGGADGALRSHAEHGNERMGARKDVRQTSRTTRRKSTMVGMAETPEG
jgi:hypothetical protein